MKRNDMWLNVKGNYFFHWEKIIRLNFYNSIDVRNMHLHQTVVLNLIEIQKGAIPLILG